MKQLKMHTKMIIVFIIMIMITIPAAMLAGVPLAAANQTTTVNVITQINITVWRPVHNTSYQNMFNANRDNTGTHPNNTMGLYDVVIMHEVEISAGQWRPINRTEIMSTGERYRETIIISAKDTSKFSEEILIRINGHNTAASTDIEISEKIIRITAINNVQINIHTAQPDRVTGSNSPPTFHTITVEVPPPTEPPPTEPPPTEPPPSPPPNGNGNGNSEYPPDDNENGDYPNIPPIIIQPPDIEVIIEIPDTLTPTNTATTGAKFITDTKIQRKPPSGLEAVIIDLFGEYEPIEKIVTGTKAISIVTINEDGTSQITRIIEPVSHVEYGINYEWFVGVGLFALILYSFFRCIGGLLKWK